MTTETHTTAASAATKAGKKAIDAVAAASENLPTVVETAELALEVPSKVVLNQKLVVVATAVAAGAAGAGVLYGLQKLKARKRLHDVNKNVDEVLGGDTSSI